MLGRKQADFKVKEFWEGMRLDLNWVSEVGGEKKKKKWEEAVTFHFGLKDEKDLATSRAREGHFRGVGEHQ